jgi:hypothetical protein
MLYVSRLGDHVMGQKYRVFNIWRCVSPTEAVNKYKVWFVFKRPIYSQLK